MTCRTAACDGPAGGATGTANAESGEQPAIGLSEQQWPPQTQMGIAPGEWLPATLLGSAVFDRASEC